MLDFDNEINPDIDTYYTEGEIKLPVQVYLPKDFDENKKYKTVVAIHGGSWEAMKETPKAWNGGWMRHCARYYAEKGLVGIVFSYRCIKLEGVGISDLISDCNDALEFIKENYSFVDFNNVIFMGDSAGGHLCLSLAMGLTLNGEPAIKSKAVIAYNPVTHCTADRWNFCGRTIEEARSASPVDNIKTLDIPILLMHGTADEIININDSRAFYEKMKDTGNDIEMIERPDENHAFILYGYRATPDEVKEDYRLTEEYLLKKIPDLYE